jgi:hypothetical protein
VVDAPDSASWRPPRRWVSRPQRADASHRPSRFPWPEPCSRSKKGGPASYPEVARASRRAASASGPASNRGLPPAALQHSPHTRPFSSTMTLAGGDERSPIATVFVHFPIPFFRVDGRATTRCYPPRPFAFQLVAVRRLMPNIGCRVRRVCRCRAGRSSWSSRGSFVWTPHGTCRASR